MARSLLWSCAIAAIHLRGPRADAGKAEAGTALSGVLKLHSNSLPNHTVYNEQSACAALRSDVAALAAQVQTGQMIIIMTGHHVGVLKAQP